jgi:hypothetical protein
MSSLPPSKPCSWCAKTDITLAAGKSYCVVCSNAAYAECIRCHKPYPSQRFFTKHDTRCNSCQSKLEKERVKRATVIAQKSREIDVSSDDSEGNPPTVYGSSSDSDESPPAKKHKSTDSISKKSSKSTKKTSLAKKVHGSTKVGEASSSSKPDGELPNRDSMLTKMLNSSGSPVDGGDGIIKQRKFGFIPVYL